MIGLLGRTRIPVLVAAGALVAAGCLDVEVTKKVTGGSSSGPFTVRVSCTEDSTTTTQDLTFTGDDTKTTNQFVLPDGATCAVTEPESAGATSVTFTCDSINPSNLGVTCTQTADGLEIVVPDDLQIGDEVTVSVTVTNDFTPPTTPPTTAPPTPEPTAAPAPAAEPAPAQPPTVVAAPTFTG
jgi:hypothetical protein